MRRRTSSRTNAERRNSSRTVRDSCSCAGRTRRSRLQTLEAAIDEDPALGSHRAACCPLAHPGHGVRHRLIGPTDRGALELARRHKLKVHMDGARFANALAFLGCAPADITWRAGVDVLSFGATKNGALAAEAVVFFDISLVRDFELRRKRAGHLISKSRYRFGPAPRVRRDGRLEAERGARERVCTPHRRGSGYRASCIPSKRTRCSCASATRGKERLRAAGFEFYDWASERSGEARFVVSLGSAGRGCRAPCAARSARADQPDVIFDSSRRAIAKSGAMSSARSSASRACEHVAPFEIAAPEIRIGLGRAPARRAIHALPLRSRRPPPLS